LISLQHTYNNQIGIWVFEMNGESRPSIKTTILSLTRMCPPF
jgi:hypothetical protein